MASPPDRSGVSLAGARELLLPLSVITSGALYYGAHLPGWTVVACAGAMVALYLYAPFWSAQSVASFDRDLVRLLATGQRHALPQRYARAMGMRLFAPPAVSAERRAVVAAENSQMGEAKASYRRAHQEYGTQAPLRVLLGYAHACYALGDDAEAIRVYRGLLEQTGSLPGVQRNLAHALVRHGESLREALELIDKDRQAAASTPERDAELDLLRAVAHAKLGERERAQALLEQSGAASGEQAMALRAELQRALDRATELRPG